MRLAVASFALSLVLARRAAGQTCAGVEGAFRLTDITGQCTYDKLLYEYTRQVFDAAGSTCASGSTLSAKDDLDAKLKSATSAATGEEGADIVCKAMYDNAKEVKFHKAADKGTDYHFEQMFYNGFSDWQEEVETLYETDDLSRSSHLREDARKVRDFYRGDASYAKVEWPNMLTNFDDSTCSSKAAMCCWPKDRQANDGNGNCATPYDLNCVDKDPADNTNLCFADYEKGNMSSGFDSAKGFAAFPEDNNNGEGAIHCHGFAWADDDYDSISRYKANNLFFVSMYDHMHQRGYVKQIPGMPMCGCMEQMPVATRSDCTQVDVTEDWTMEFDGTSFTGKMDKVEIDFNSCQGRRNRNNDLWAYSARLFDEGRITREQFSEVGRVLTNDHDCYHQTEYEKAKKGLIVGYTAEKTMWTQAAGRDDMYIVPMGRETFKKALTPDAANGHYGIVMRICPDCTDTHRYIYYRRLTEITDPNFDLLHEMMYRHSSSGHAQNRWSTDFSLHSTYADAVSGDEPWQCPGGVFNYWATFYGECSPTGARVHHQHSRFNSYPGPRPNVAFYVNKAEDAGLVDYSANSAVLRLAGETDMDIGHTGIPGNTLEDNGVFHIFGAGKDIWDKDDEFHYMSIPYSGDVDVKVHAMSLTYNHGWAKAGIMLRSDNSIDATHAFMLLSGNQGTSVHFRRSKGRSTDFGGHWGQGSTTSAWLRIVKKMEDVEFYESADGESWTHRGTHKVFFPEDSFRVGLAVTSNEHHFLSEATFKDYTIEQYNFPSPSPSISIAPTMWEPKADIGPHTRVGNYWVDANGKSTVQGSGTGIRGSSDDFFFYNNQYGNSDFSVSMKIERFDNHDFYARGGIMVRASLDADAVNVFVGAAGADQGATFQCRAATGGDTVHHQTRYTNGINAHWVKLDKVGDVFTAYYKVEEADAWVMLGKSSITVDLTGVTTLNVGQAVASGRTDTHLWTMESTGFEVTV